MDNLKHKWLLSPTKKDFDIVAEMKDIKESTDHLVSVSNAMKMRKTEEIIADIRRDLFLAINPIVSKLDKDKFIVEETTNLDLYEGGGPTRTVYYLSSEPEESEIKEKIESVMEKWVAIGAVGLYAYGPVCLNKGEVIIEIGNHIRIQNILPETFECCIRAKLASSDESVMIIAKLGDAK